MGIKKYAYEVYKIADNDDNEDEIKTLIKVSIFDDLVVDINNIFSWRMH